MVDSGTRKDIAQTGPYKLALVPVGDCELLEKNARYMKHETFRNLSDNVKRDGALSSVPFCVLTEDGKFRVLSGNHRVMAAKDAGLDEIPVLYTDQPLSRDEEIAIQISHNALVGEDDPIILRELYNEIEDLTMKYYSGLDDKALEQLEKVQIAGLSDAQLDFLTLTYMFLPEEIEHVREVFEKAKAVVAGETFLARWSDYDRLLDGLSKTQASFNIHNGATSLMIILDVFERNIEDLKAGWLGEEGQRLHDGWVPLATVLGTDKVPSEVALLLNQVVDKMVANGDITTKAKWRALELIAADYLAGGTE